MSGGVRNLRAMFENKEDTAVSPPDRGRSPAGSHGAHSNGTSPAPLSKVRTSFVAVERSGQAGSQLGLRKGSNVAIDIDSSSTIPEGDSASAEPAEKNGGSGVMETMSQESITPPSTDSELKSSHVNGKAAGAKHGRRDSVPNANPDKITSAEDPYARLLPGDPKSSEAVTGGAALNHVGGIGEKIHSLSEAKSKPDGVAKALVKSSPTTRGSKPAAMSTTKSSSSAKAAGATTKPTATGKTPAAALGSTRSPTASKSDKAPAKPAPMKAGSATLHATAPPKALEKKTSRASVAPASSSKNSARPTATASKAGPLEKNTNTTASTATAGTKATTSATEKKTASPPSAFHKPRPKSPTKPVELPSRLTAPTRSSLSKVTGVPSASRHSLGPSISRSNNENRASLGGQGLQRAASKREPTRSTMGPPPPHKTVSKQPSRPSLASKSAAPADEGFLARMMRPTTASASKTHEKVTTPPRVKVPTSEQAASRPTTRDGAAHHPKPHEESKGSPSAEKTRSLEIPKGVKTDSSTARKVSAPKSPAAKSAAQKQDAAKPAGKEEEHKPYTTKELAEVPEVKPTPSADTQTKEDEDEVVYSTGDAGKTEEPSATVPEAKESSQLQEAASQAKKPENETPTTPKKPSTPKKAATPNAMTTPSKVISPTKTVTPKKAATPHMAGPSKHTTQPEGSNKTQQTAKKTEYVWHPARPFEHRPKVETEGDDEVVYSTGDAGKPETEVD